MCVIDPLVPVIVIVEVPAGVLLPAVIVRVEGVPALIEVGLNKAEAPVGKPLTLKPTTPLKPFKAPTFTV